ncbi:MAG: hypothetical protein A2X67_11395 [Ignavibacteria bacterium GWA2_55_11]|nr:MAG: hypothetical protein A2X67_11395 [Ignavibacteria bacterium GWA2_55_11]OGU70720.1 MAG: hypothetical protein A3G43_12765 [Ignavibacteria bacterium RIFCSPLOWO2_12_FULL_56_21]OGU72298.1 MAG: hypothetical protein A3H45_08165 [Ignavibacteria bacterium RIFCSPLOWO2_02_FULL_55_14]
MGRAGLMLVMGLAVAFGYIGANLRDSGEALTVSQVGYYKYSFARNLARLGINRHLRYVDRGATPPTSATFESGSYTISTTSVGDTLTIVSTGTYAESSYVMRAKLLFTPKPFPMADAAVGIRAEPAELNFSGKAWVDGRNYSADGSTLIGSGDKPGVTVMNATDSANIYNSGGSNITGSPQVSTDASATDPGPFIPEYEQSAHYVFNTPGVVSGNYTFGSAPNPVIVVCNTGSADTSFSIKFTGDIVGYGILAINGNVKFGGGFRWYGLVIAYGMNNVITFEAAGTPEIVGALMVAGNEGASLTLRGTGDGGKVKYSSDALDNARRIGRLLYYSVIEWYE